MIQEGSTKENLLMMSEKGTVMRNTIIGMFTLVTLREEKLMVKDSTHGLTESITKGNGTWAKNMGLGNGREPGEKPISVTGRWGRQMGKGHTLGRMGTSMKVTGWTV